MTKTKILTTLAVMMALFAYSSAQSSSSPQQSSTTEARTAVPVAVGAIAPDFTLEDQQGRSVMLSASRGKNPVVLVFYRGYW